MSTTPSLVHLPNGQTLTVTPVFGGLFFKSNDLTVHGSIFPAGWTIILETEVHSDGQGASNTNASAVEQDEEHRHRSRPFSRPTLQGDSVFISSISNPSSNDFKPPASPTRQIAMMLWTTLYWYFHQPAPPPYLKNEHSKNTPEAGKPRGEWRVNVKKEGVFRGKNLLQKLGRMGLVSSEDSAVGCSTDDRTAEGWSEMFTSRRAFWQLNAKIFLFTLSPSTFNPGSPHGSRPSSPNRALEHARGHSAQKSDSGESLTSPGPGTVPPPGPFASASHLPTYYPPPPLQYTMSGGVRHPVRTKPGRQGETIYTRFIPSVGQFLSFRIASMSPSPVGYTGPVSTAANQAISSLPSHVAASALSDSTNQRSPRVSTRSDQATDTTMMTDLQLLNKWMNDDRVAKFWGCKGPLSTQEAFLRSNLQSKHSFPVIGLWDGKPFGYMEIYWVKEDCLGKLLGYEEVGEFTRGIHVLVGEQEFRGKYRLKSWMTALVHWAFIEDMRTDSVVLEPRVDNERFISHLLDMGFSKEKEVDFPHKRSAFVRLRRETFEAPVL